MSQFEAVAFRIGLLVLDWGRMLGEESPEKLEEFIDALGFSSVPEACNDVADTLGVPQRPDDE